MSLHTSLGAAAPHPFAPCTASAAFSHHAHTVYSACMQQLHMCSHRRSLSLSLCSAEVDHEQVLVLLIFFLVKEFGVKKLLQVLELLLDLFLRDRSRGR